MWRMKKKVLIIIAIVLVLILSVVAYFYIWGGKPKIENFEEVSNDYEIVAQLALNTYTKLSPEDKYIIINIHNCDFKYDKSNLPLTEAQQNAVRIASEKFDYLRVCKDAVFFCEDETGYYGLVYSKHPIAALYKAELLQQGREYHRINSRWYEWGVWGI